MRKEKINGHNVEFYDSIDQLPIVRFHAYTKFMLVASGLGDTIDDIDRHLERLVDFVKHDTKKALKEIQNLRNTLYIVATQQDIRHKGALNLIYSVDGKEWTDYSDSGLDALFTLLNGESEAQMRKKEGEIISRIDEGLHTYFPSLFNGSEGKNKADLLRRKALLLIDATLNKTDNTEELVGIEKELVRMTDVGTFTGEQSEEVQHEKKFNEMCLLMSKEFSTNAKNYTTLEYYSAQETLKKQSDELKKLKK